MEKRSAAVLFVTIFFLFIIAISSPNCEAEVLNWFDFSLARDFPQESQVTWSPDPITSGDQISVVGDHFEVGGERIRLFGINFTASGNFLPADKAERTAERIAELGFNFVKFTLMGGRVVEGYDLNSDPPEIYLDQTALDRMENFIEELKQNGVYVGLQFGGLVGGLNRPSIYFNEKFISLQKSYIEEVITDLGIYSPTTGATDPVLAQIQYINEIYLLQAFSRCRLHTEQYCEDRGVSPGSYQAGFSALGENYAGNPEPMSEFRFGGVAFPKNVKVEESDTLDRLFNQKMKEVYGNTENLRSAWGGLDEGEDLDPDGDEDASDGTVKRVLHGNDTSGYCYQHYSHTRCMDTTTFYYNLARKHIRDIYNFITDDSEGSLGIGEIIVTAIENFDGLQSKFVQNETNTLAQHIPWAHPKYGSGGFLEPPFQYINSPMLDGPVTDSQTTTDWVWWRELDNTIWKAAVTSTVEGKPFILSEYSHPLPNEFHTEYPILISSYGLLQDWDGIVLHEYVVSSGALNNNFIDKGFELESNPSILAQIPAASRIFRHGWIDTTTNTITIPFWEDGQYDGETGVLNTWWDCHPLHYCYWREQGLGDVWKQSLVHKTRMSFGTEQGTVPSPGVPNSPYISDTGQLRWDTDAGLLTANSGKVNAVIGFPNNKSYNLSHLGIEPQEGSDFTAASLIPLDDKELSHSRRLLLTVAGRVKNTGMSPSPPQSKKEHTFDSWGTSPVKAEAVKAQVNLSSLAGGPISVYAMNPDGTAGSLIAEDGGGAINFEINSDTAAQKSLWYVITVSSTDTASVFRVDEGGNVFADKSFYGEGFETASADVAEFVRVSEDVESGDLIEIDSGEPDTYRKSRTKYSELVAGVISTKPGLTLSDSDDNAGKARLAMSGTVPLKVTAENGPIEPGDLLTSSSEPGYAMVCENTAKCNRAIVGKALEGLKSGKGVIRILLM